MPSLPRDPDSLPCDPSHEDTLGVPVPGVTAEDLVTALLAMGVDFGDALSQVVATLGPSCAQSCFERYAKGQRAGLRVVGALDEVARYYPGMANTWLSLALDQQWVQEWKWNLADGRNGFFLKGRHWLKSLPDGLEVQGALMLERCRGLQSLPRGLKVGSVLDISDCDAVVALPAGLRVGGDLWGMACRGLTTIASGVRVEGSLRLVACDHLASMGNNLHVGKDLRLACCYALRTLGECLDVGGDLDLCECRLLERLPQDFRVGGDLKLLDCPAWDGHIPTGGHVGGVIHTDECPRGVPMDQWRARQAGRGCA